MNESGFVVLYRSLLNWKYHDFPAAMSLWVHILLMANWKDGFFLGESIPRGALATSYNRLATEVGLEQKTVRKWLKRFEADEMITVKSTQRFTIIKVLKYSDFQGIRDKGYGAQSGLLYGQPDGVPDGQLSGPNRTKKQSNKETNNPPKPPRGGRGTQIRIEPPEWYRKQKAGETDVSDADPEETEALIAEIEDMKRRMNEQ